MPEQLEMKRIFSRQAKNRRRLIPKGEVVATISGRQSQNSYWVCTPVVTACPLSVLTVVEQPEKTASRRTALSVERRIVRISVCSFS
jgi:hypothetical protein